jgi:peroxiredoxin
MKKLTVATLSIALVLGSTLAGIYAQECADDAVASDQQSDKNSDNGTQPALLEADQARLIDYLATKIIERGSITFTADEIVEATGIPKEQIDLLNGAEIQNAVIAELTGRLFDVTSLAGASHCAEFSACSIDRNLSGASGEELALYQFEKAQDGKLFQDMMAPDFTLPATNGKQISLSDYAGKYVALAFLSGHCNHSLQTLHMLREISQKKLPADLVVLPVYVNSGSVEDVRSWSDALKMQMPLLVDEGTEIAGKYDFRMVPSVFLVDDKGRILKKLVGQKDEGTLSAAFTELTGSTPAVARN